MSTDAADRRDQGESTAEAAVNSQAQASNGASEAKPEPPKRIDEIDRLRANTLQQAATILVQRKQILLHQSRELQQQGQQVDADLKAAQDNIEAFKKEMGEKYGVDFRRQQIHPDTGRIVNVAPQQPR